MHSLLTFIKQYPVPTLLASLLVAGASSVFVAAYIQTSPKPPQAPQTPTTQTSPTPSKGQTPSDEQSTTTPAAEDPSSPATQPQKTTQNTPTAQKTPGVSTPSTKPTPSPTSPSPKPSQTCPAGQSGAYPNCATPTPTPTGLSGSWNLILQDEFNGSHLNTNLWSTQRGPSYSYGDPYNPSIEAAYYAPDVPYVDNGNLVLTLTKKATGGYPYTSGMVQNGRSFSYTYGYTESRIKVPGNTGVWPAYWTLPAPVDQYWPPEIDIFEFGLGSQTRPSFNYHYGTAPNNKQHGLVEYGSPSVDYTKDFHIYGMLWTPNKIQVYLDGVPGPSYTNSANITSLPQYLIFNLALKKNANVPNGTAMYIDYVRVWQ